MHADKFAYFLIAFAVYILLKAVALYKTLPVVNILFYVSMAISLLASNIPRVMDIPYQYAYPVKRVEQFTFFVSIVCFIALCIRYLLR